MPTCPRCGIMLASKAKDRCAHCGASLRPPEADSGGGHFVSSAIGIALLVVLLVATLIVVAWSIESVNRAVGEAIRDMLEALNLTSD